MLCTLINLYIFLIFARIVLSWFPIADGGPMGQVNRALSLVTEPVLGAVRRVIPPVRMGGMGLDLSALIVTMVLSLFVRPLLCG